MADTCLKIEVIPERVRRTIFNKIKRIAFKHNGIIFGGYVRDAIISEYYSKLYNRASGSIKQYWDTTFDPDSKARTLNADDMDICFHSDEDSHAFIDNVIDSFSLATNNNYDFKQEELLNTNVYNSGMNTLKSVKRLSFDIKLGRIPFVFSGYDLAISIDVVIPFNTSLLPPFNNLDFLCNAFIMTKHGTCLSTCTGTNMDHLSDVARSKVNAKIMQDVVEFKTDFCMGQKAFNYKSGTLQYNKYIIKRIDKMLAKQPVWHINNLPFSMHTESIHGTEGTNDTCCICLSNVKHTGDIMICTYMQEIQSSISHYKCLTNWFKAQIEAGEEKLTNEEFTLTCPYRNPINFVEAGKASKHIILEYAGLT